MFKLIFMLVLSVGLSLAGETKCKPNEIYDICPHPCPSRTCGIDDTLIDCKEGPRPGDPKCPRPKCRCKPQTFRDDKDNCVPWEQCPTCPGENEEYSPCFSPCSVDRCFSNGTVVKSEEDPLILGDPRCVKGCRCKFGYLRNEDDICVSEDECKAKCKKNEVYDVCPNNCPARTCGIDDTLIDCVEGLKPGDPKCPPPKCKCKPQFFRDDKDNCVPWEQCPTCPGPNEEYSPCFSPCSQDRCNLDRTLIRCIPPPSLGDPGCVRGCRCKFGFLKNEKNVCVTKDQCKPKCKKNEVLEECPPKCPFRTCGIDDSLIDCSKDQPVPGDPNCPRPKCRCKPNFFKDDKENCVPWDQCPTCSGPHEQYDPCFSPCGLDRCDFDPKVVKCIPPPQLGDSGCVAGCRCEDGYARNGTENICIRKDLCPCGGDPNAQSGCGGFCTRCSNYKKGPIKCKLACRLGACDCRKGFIYDEIQKKCVLPKDCSIPATTTTTTTELPHSCDEDPVAE